MGNFDHRSILVDSGSIAHWRQETREKRDIVRFPQMWVFYLFWFLHVLHVLRWGSVIDIWNFALPTILLAHHTLEMTTRAHREIKNQNKDSHTWIFIGNWILNLICFLQFFDLSTPSAAKMRFYYLHFLQGKNAQNRPENPQNWNLAKIGLKSDNFMK